MSQVQPRWKGSRKRQKRRNAARYKKARLEVIERSGGRCEAAIEGVCKVRGTNAHLEPVTPRTNTMRGLSFAAVNAAKTHCVNGHPFDEANTYHDPKTGWRCCRACARASFHRSKARRRAASK